MEGTQAGGDQWGLCIEFGTGMKGIGEERVMRVHRDLRVSDACLSELFGGCIILGEGKSLVLVWMIC